MENQAQTPSTPETPTATGPSVAELQAQMESLKKESEGRLRDLQSERTKRQELESRLNSSAPASSADPQSDVTQDELGKVLKPYIAPLEQRVRVAEAVAAQSIADKAFAHLSAKTGKTKQQILDDKALQGRLDDIVRRYGFSGDLHSLTVKAYDIMELEDLKTQEAERRRAAEANANASVPAGNPAPPVPSSKEWSSSDWATMPLHEYEQYASKGSFREKDGKIVFVPNK